MLLKNKIAVVYGAAGSIGGAVSKIFAKEGATVYVTGRTVSALEKLVDEIKNFGGKAIGFVVDAMNSDEVEKHLNKVISLEGKVDISFNAIGIDNKQGVPLTTLSIDEFVQPIEMTMRTQFITCTAAARMMEKQNSGVIISLTATPGGIGYPGVGGFGPACAALESFSKHLATEVGIHGIRVVNIRSGGSPDTRPFLEAIEARPEVMKEVLYKMKSDTMLKELPMKNDIANVAAFLASDMAAKITGVTIDVTAGTTQGINYRTTTG